MASEDHVDVLYVLMWFCQIYACNDCMSLDVTLFAVFMQLSLLERC